MFDLLWHRYEREETFMALNLGVTSCQSLEISLDQFVRGEVLEGSNAYYCEKCKEKVCIVLCMLLFYYTDVMCTYNVYMCSSAQRTTVKRTCIKSLPSVLCIHLMRFGFDWESGRSIKYDEQIRVRSISNPKIINLHSLGYTFSNQMWFVWILYCWWTVPMGAEHGALHCLWNGSSRLQRRGRRGARRWHLRRVPQEESHDFWELWTRGSCCPQRSGTCRTLLLLH